MGLNIGGIQGYLGLDDAPFADGLDSALERLKSFGGKGAALAAVAGVAIATAIGVSIASAMNIEKANDKLSAQLGLTAAESERIGGVAGRLYAQAYGDSIDDVNTAVGAVVSSIEGMRTASDGEVEAMTAKAMNLASAFDLDVTEAVNSVGIVMKSGLAQNAEEAFDLMTAAMQKMPAAMRGELMEATDEYGDELAALGITGERAFGLLVEASKGGTYGIDKTGDALKEFTVKTTDMSTTSVTAFNALGLNAEEMSNKILAGGTSASGAFDQIVTGLLGIKDPTEQANAAIALFGTPLEDLGVSKIPQFLKGLKDSSTALGDASGAADAMGQTLNDNAATNFLSFKRQLEGIVTGFGAHLLPIVNIFAAVLVNSLGPALNFVGNLISDNSTAIGIVAGLIAAVMIPRLIVWGVQSTIAAAKATAAWVTSQAAAARSAAIQVASWTVMGARAMATGALYVAAFAMMGASAAAAAAKQVAVTVAMGAYAAVTGVVRAATIAWTAVQWLLNAAMAANPIGLVVLAIVALIAGIVLLWNNCEAFRTVVLAVWEAIKTAISSVVDWLVGTAWPFIQQVWDGIVTGVGFLWTGIQLYFKLIQLYITTVWNVVKAIITFVVGFIVAYVTTYFTILKTVVTTIWNGIKAVVEFAINAIKAAMNAIGSVVSRVIGFFTSLKDGIVERLQSALAFVMSIPGKILGALGNVGTMLLDSGRKIIQGLIDGIMEKVQAVKDAVGNVMSAARDLLPFSPAKEGPFSGAGWTLYSGEAIMSGLAEGISGGGPAARDALNRELRSMSGLLPSGGLSVDASMHANPRPAARAGATNTFNIYARDKPTPKVITTALNEAELLQPGWEF